MVSNIFYFHPYLGKVSILTNIFQRGWNHQPETNMKMENHLTSFMVDYSKNVTTPKCHDWLENQPWMKMLFSIENLEFSS